MPKEILPSVIWFTGLPAAGKSTLADGLAERLRRRGATVERLDGDILRQQRPETGFSREARENHLRRAGAMAAALEKQGKVVVASFVSPYRAIRHEIRVLCRNFIEIHVSTPLEVCERRDPKGLYARARRGELRDLTGVGDVYEIPDSPELAIDTSTTPLEDALRRVLDCIERKSHAKPS